MKDETLVHNKTSLASCVPGIVLSALNVSPILILPAELYYVCYHSQDFTDEDMETERLSFFDNDKIWEVTLFVYQARLLTTSGYFILTI